MGEHVALPPSSRQVESALGDEGNDVEVDPPHSRGESDSQHRGDVDTGGQLALGGMTKDDDRFTEGDDDDQVVALGEMRRNEPTSVHPSLGAEQRRPGPIEHDRQTPQRSRHGCVEERSNDEQTHGDRRAHREGRHRAS